MEIDPASLIQRDRYKLLIGGIIPRPIAFVSTVSPDGRRNLAPFSFFAGVSSEPMSLLFCPANKPDGTEKDTLRNLLAAGRGPDAEGGEFVVSVVRHAIARPMALCAEELPYGASEFELAKLAPAPSHSVRPARVGESLLSYECRVMKVIRLAPGAPGGGNIVIGRIVWVHADDSAIDAEYRLNPGALDAVGRMGGLSYCTTRDRFELPMGVGRAGG